MRAMLAIVFLVALSSAGPATAASLTPGSNRCDVVLIAGYSTSYAEFTAIADSNGYDTNHNYYGGLDADESVVRSALSAGSGLFVYEAHKVIVGNGSGAFYLMQLGSTREDMSDPGSTTFLRVVDEFAAVYDIDRSLVWVFSGPGSGVTCLGVRRDDITPSNFYSGSSPILCLAMCNSTSETASDWGARVLVRSTSPDPGASDLCGKFTALMGIMSARTANRDLGSAISGISDITYSGAGNTTLSPWLIAISPAANNVQGSMWQTVTLTFDTEVDVSTCGEPCGAWDASLAVINGFIRNVSRPNESQATAEISGRYSDFSLLIKGDAGTYDGDEIHSRYGHLPFNHGLDLEVPYRTFEVNPAGEVLAFWARGKPSGNAVYAAVGCDRGTALWRVERADESGLVTVAERAAADIEAGVMEFMDTSAKADASYYLTEVECDGRVVPQGICTPFESQATLSCQGEARDESASSVRAVADPAGGLAVIYPDSFTTALAPYVTYWTNCGISVALHSSPSWTAASIDSVISLDYSRGIRYYQLVGSYSDHEWFDDVSKWPDDPNSASDWFYFYNRYHSPAYGYVAHPEWDIMPTLWYPDTEIDNWSYYFPYYSSDLGYVLDRPGAQIGRFPAYNAVEVAAWVTKTIAYASIGTSQPWYGRATVAVESYVNGSPGSESLVDDLVTSVVLPGFPAEISANVIASRYSAPLTASEKIDLIGNAYNQGCAVIAFLGTYSSNYRLGSFIDMDNGWTAAQWSAGTALPFLLGTSCEAIGFSGVRYDARGPGVQRVLSSWADRGFIGSFGPRGGSGMTINALVARRVLSQLYMGEERSIAASCTDAIRDLLTESADISLQLGSYSYDGCVRSALHCPELTTDVSTADGHLRLSTTQNPFCPAGSISFVSPRCGLLTAMVYDVRGRRVDSLAFNRLVEAGPQVISWDGCDRRGAMVASGVYFVRVQLGEEEATAKVVVVR